MNRIGKSIRNIREQKGYSQENVAKELGISQPSYARLEQKDDRISVTRLIKIAEFLEIHPNYFFEDNKNSFKPINSIESLDMNHEIVNLLLKNQMEQVKDMKKEVDLIRKIWSDEEIKSAFSEE
jgi:transcriptional regulator with XRE-family HTH domain